MWSKKRWGARNSESECGQELGRGRNPDCPGTARTTSAQALIPGLLTRMPPPAFTSLSQANVNEKLRLSFRQRKDNLGRHLGSAIRKAQIVTEN